MCILWSVLAISNTAECASLLFINVPAAPHDAWYDTEFSVSWVLSLALFSSIDYSKKDQGVENDQ